MAEATLTGTVNVPLGTTEVSINISRNLFRKKVATTGTSNAVVTALTGALRTITITGIYTGSSGVLDAWESAADLLWASVGIPEVKVFTTYSGETFNVLPDSLTYKRIFNRVEYTLSLVETILS